MFIKIGNRIINTNQIVDAQFSPAGKWVDDEQEPPKTIDTPAALELTMTSLLGLEVSDFDGNVVTAYSESDTIILKGREAENVWAYLYIQATHVDYFTAALRSAS